jgi:hypothetical protein
MFACPALELILLSRLSHGELLSDSVIAQKETESQDVDHAGLIKEIKFRCVFVRYGKECSAAKEIAGHDENRLRICDKWRTTRIVSEGSRQIGPLFKACGCLFYPAAHSQTLRYKIQHCIVRGRSHYYRQVSGPAKEN